MGCCLTSTRQKKGKALRSIAKIKCLKEDNLSLNQRQDGGESGIMILYKSFFSGWLVITPEQKQILIKHFRSGMTAVKESEKGAIIGRKFLG